VEVLCEGSYRAEVYHTGRYPVPVDGPDTATIFLQVHLVTVEYIQGRDALSRNGILGERLLHSLMGDSSHAPFNQVGFPDIR
jgi:hypothetical protein